MVLKNHQSFHLELGKLPKGKYIYRFGVNGPAEKTGTLSISIESNGSRISTQAIPFTNDINEHELVIDCKEDFAINALLFQGDDNISCILRLPVSALSMHEISDRPAALGGLDQNIVSRVNSLDSTDNLMKKRRELANNHTPDHFHSQQVNIEEIEGFINLRYFEGFLSMEQAMRQLDFVVYEKMFRDGRSKGFTRFKRKVYGKTLRFLYRTLTRNYSRKQYFAKLYRNYINSNLLAENYHKHQ